mmetsp:Transcript_44401/g.117382  ORF Transcript_44401/g.117382 Transcript_44401/m.117382 type:complete len:203 (+) Transcript_44401:415-1023(+)
MLRARSTGSALATPRLLRSRALSRSSCLAPAFRAISMRAAIGFLADFLLREDPSRSPATIISYLSATSRSSVRRPEKSGPSVCSRLALPFWRNWCLESTWTAFLRLVIAWTLSFSSPLNSAASFSRIAVACASIALSSAICFLRVSISADSTPNFAARSSISVPSSRSFASASAIALVFSFSFVSHQHTILSYISASFFASA